MKVTKASVHYRQAGSSTRRCKNCTMYRSGACTLVAGRIFPEGVCDEFDPKKELAHAK